MYDPLSKWVLTNEDIAEYAKAVCLGHTTINEIGEYAGRFRYAQSSSQTGNALNLIYGEFWPESVLPVIGHGTKIEPAVANGYDLHFRVKDILILQEVPIPSSVANEYPRTLSSSDIQILHQMDISAATASWYLGLNERFSGVRVNTNDIALLEQSVQAHETTHAEIERLVREESEAKRTESLRALLK